MDSGSGEVWGERVGVEDSGSEVLTVKVRPGKGHDSGLFAGRLLA
jgi:hypothetical protein